NADLVPFSVHELTGELRINGIVDREHNSEYELQIVARDYGAYNPLSSTAVVRIVVDDENDNAPQFTSQSHMVRIREDVPVGTIVANLHATDPDLHLGGDIWYSLVSHPTKCTIILIF